MKLIDREEVLTALEHCSIFGSCKGCPYQQKDKMLFGCITCDSYLDGDYESIPNPLLRKVIELLKQKTINKDEQKMLKLYRKYHRKALENPLVIMKPRAWALYQTWREIDIEEGRSNNEN